jgi:hypothetical protein
MSKADLRIDWATHEAAKYACEHWHYSGCMPVGKLVKVGAWENGKFIGVVLFGRGAAINIGSPFGLPQTEVCELVRVALRPHATPVSRIMAIALKFMRQANPLMRLVISFADTERGHHGGIYQANGWIYCGDSTNDRKYKVKGKVYHPKTLHSLYGKGGQSIPWLRANIDSKAISFVTAGKHKYLMPLDAEMKAAILPLSKPYPKRASSETSDTTGNLPEKGGATPTDALHLTGGDNA